MEKIDDISILEQLLIAISWDGKTVKRYRQGGLEYENVLTALVLQGLDFLPRQHFLGAIINRLNGNYIDQVREQLIGDIESTNILLSAVDFYLDPSQKTNNVQFDGMLETEQVFTLVEAKRIKSNAKFQVDQLTREFLVVTRDANNRLPLLLLIIGEKPPIKVDKFGRISIKDAVLAMFPEVLEKTEDYPYDLAQVVTMIDSTIAWITWEEIKQILKEQLKTFEIDSSSTKASVERIANSIINAIERHENYNL